LECFKSNARGPQICNDSHEFLPCIPLYHKNSSKNFFFHFLINWSFLKTACGCQYLMNIDHFGDDKIDNYRIWIYKDNIYTSKFVIDNVCVSLGNKVFLVKLLEFKWIQIVLLSLLILLFGYESQLMATIQKDNSKRSLISLFVVRRYGNCKQS
jgi:hypothetical protein